MCTKSIGSGWVHVRVIDVDVAVAAKLVGDGGVISMQGIDEIWDMIRPQFVDY